MSDIFGLNYELWCHKALGSVQCDQQILGHGREEDMVLKGLSKLCLVGRTLHPVCLHEPA